MRKIAKIVKPVKKNITNLAMNTFQDVKNTANKTMNLLTNDLNNYTPKAIEIINKYGNEVIRSLELKRTPVNSAITGALNMFSLGKFGERFEKNFDELFHLFLLITTVNGNKILIEKNERINIDASPPDRPETQIKVISNVPQGLTINRMLQQAQNNMGSQYFNYHPVNNNCQDFLLGVLKSNGIGDQTDYDFIKQDTDKLFKGMPILSKVAYGATQLGEKANAVMNGGKILKSKNIENYAMFLNHLTSHITDPKEPIDIRDFKQAIKAINIIKNLKGGGLEKKSKFDIQSIVFLKKHKWNVTKSKKWLKDRKFSTDELSVKEGTIRFTQINPHNFTEFKTFPLSDGILIVLGLE